MKRICILLPVIAAMLLPLLGCSKKKPVEYWRTERTWVIHNSSCRWYEKSEGEMVSKDAQGRDCKLCGGRNRR